MHVLNGHELLSLQISYLLERLMGEPGKHPLKLRYKVRPHCAGLGEKYATSSVVQWLRPHAEGTGLIPSPGNSACHSVWVSF